jgi:3-oxoadipate enol-lactonase
MGLARRNIPHAASRYALCMQITNDDASLYYEIHGNGPDLVLLHPFPANHKFWLPIVDALAPRFRLTLPDLRGHGQSQPGDGAATMQKHVRDLLRICEEARIQRAVFVGCSIGGYVNFELWRQARERVKAFVFMDTKAPADSEEARANRLKSADDVLARGPEAFIDGMLPKLIGRSTRSNRPDIASAARAMMLETSAAGIAAIQRGMAERTDSTPTLSTITVPTLVVFGEEDDVPISEGEAIRAGIRNSEMGVIEKAGHYAVFEKPEESGRILREWLEKLPRS